MTVLDLVELVRPAGYAVLALAALLLVAESALLIGVVLPGISVTVGLGVLAETGAVATPVATVTAVAAAVLGPSLGYRAARRARAGWIAAHAPERSLGLALDLARNRPLVSVGVGQWFAVARTLVPRLAGSTLRHGRGTGDREVDPGER